MAKMIPEIVGRSASGGEKRIFSLFENAVGTEDWICLHSLGLAHHDYKRRAEIDFLLITPKGVFVLEVKSGRIAREEGKWVYIDRFGRRHAKTESPFDQASSAMFALERALKKKFEDHHRLPNILLGYGVMFPDIEFDISGTDFDRRMVYDLRDRRKSIVGFIDRLTQATYSTQTGKERFAPSEKDRELLIEFLRGDFEFIPSLSIAAENARNELSQLTKEQFAVLDAFVSYPRCLVEGSAGTGKTLLAVEAVRRESRRGKKILFLCFNRNLAAYLQTALASEAEQAQVKTVYQMLDDVIVASSISQDFQAKRKSADPDDLYGKLYPEYATLAAIENDVEIFDVLIVDEGQDLMTNELLDVLDLFLLGGLESGRWRFFFDSNNQAAVFGRFEEEALQRLRNFGSTSILPVNCRNTKQIVQETSIIVEPKKTAVARISGKPVEYSWYKNQKDQAQKLDALLKRLIKDGAKHHSISVLSPRSKDKSCLVIEDEFSEGLLTQITPENLTKLFAPGASSIGYSTISSFKGLENDIVVLVDIENIAAPWWRSVIYVGMSRARLSLHLLISNDLKEHYEERISKWILNQEMLSNS